MGRLNNVRPLHIDACRTRQIVSPGRCSSGAGEFPTARGTNSARLSLLQLPLVFSLRITMRRHSDQNYTCPAFSFYLKVNVMVQTSQKQMAVFRIRTDRVNRWAESFRGLAWERLSASISRLWRISLVFARSFSSDRCLSISRSASAALSLRDKERRRQLEANTFPAKRGGQNKRFVVLGMERSTRTVISRPTCQALVEVQSLWTQLFPSPDDGHGVQSVVSLGGQR